MNEVRNNVLRDARWTFCHALYGWRDQGVSESNIRLISKSMRYQLSDAEIREQILYLQELGYCTVEKLEIDGSLFATRTAKLTNLVEFNDDCPPSIARPEKKWW